MYVCVCVCMKIPDKTKYFTKNKKSYVQSNWFVES